MRYMRGFGYADINPFHCFYLLQKKLIYDTISPTPRGKSRMMVVGGGEKQREPPPGAPLCASTKYYTHGKIDIAKNGETHQKWN